MTSYNKEWTGQLAQCIHIFISLSTVLLKKMKNNSEPGNKAGKKQMHFAKMYELKKIEFLFQIYT